MPSGRTRSGSIACWYRKNDSVLDVGRWMFSVPNSPSAMPAAATAVTATPTAMVVTAVIAATKAKGK